MERKTIHSDNSDISVNKKKAIIAGIAALILVVVIITIVISKSNANNKGMETNNLLTQVDIDNSDEATMEQTREYTYYSYQDYSEGLAWVNYTDGYSEYWGCIDKSGKMVFNISASNIIEITPFSNGYSYIINDNTIRIINSKGEIKTTYETNDNNKAVAYGEGYLFIQEHVADFDSSVYNYYICDAEGNKIESFSLPELKEYYGFTFFGKGIFGYYEKPFNYKTYVPKAKKWVEFDGITRPFFYDNMSLIKMKYGGGYDSSDGFRIKLQILDSETGEITYVTLPKDYGWNDECSGINEGLCLLIAHYSEGEFLASYNVNNNEFNKIDQSNAEKVIYDELQDDLFFYNKRVAIPMRGLDNKKYFSIFDDKFKAVINPIEIGNNSKVVYKEGMIIIRGSDELKIYNDKGELVFDPLALGYESISDYNDGVCKLEGQSVPTYIDKNGDIIFDKVLIDLK